MSDSVAVDVATVAAAGPGDGTASASNGDTVVPNAESVVGGREGGEVAAAIADGVGKVVVVSITTVESESERDRERK